MYKNYQFCCRHSKIGDGDPRNNTNGQIAGCSGLSSATHDPDVGTSPNGGFVQSEVLTGEGLVTDQVLGSLCAWHKSQEMAAANSVLPVQSNLGQSDVILEKDRRSPAGPVDAELQKAVDDSWRKIELQCSQEMVRRTDAKRKGDKTDASPLQVGWKIIRVFVSSTFTDMHSEREILVKKVCSLISI